MDYTTAHRTRDLRTYILQKISGDFSSDSRDGAARAISSGVTGNTPIFNLEMKKLCQKDRARCLKWVDAIKGDTAVVEILRRTVSG